jgi:hypothetical protein
VKLLLLILCCVALQCTRTVTKIEYRDVYIPVRCNINIPDRPAYNPNTVMGVINVLEYCEKLEVLLKTCTGGK